jgi:DnaK suppressor protein
MNEKQYLHFNKRIQEEILKTEFQINNLIETTKPISPDNSIGRLTRMEAIGEKSINEAALRLAKERLSKLNTALIRLKDEEFGLCLACEEEIFIKRLESVPEATLCISCAENIKK